MIILCQTPGFAADKSHLARDQQQIRQRINSAMQT